MKYLLMLFILFTGCKSYMESTDSTCEAACYSKFAKKGTVIITGTLIGLSPENYPICRCFESSIRKGKTVIKKRLGTIVRMPIQQTPAREGNKDPRRR